jgi:hypothetical protein
MWNETRQYDAWGQVIMMMPLGSSSINQAAW